MSRYYTVLGHEYLPTKQHLEVVPFIETVLATSCGKACEKVVRYNHRVIEVSAVHPAGDKTLYKARQRDEELGAEGWEFIDAQEEWPEDGPMGTPTPPLGQG